MATDDSSGQDLRYERRLHARWQFLKFFGKAEVFRLSQCIVFRIPNDLGHFRLGITLKTKGSSIERNRTKRQIRENMRKLSALLGAFDYNVVVPASKKMTHPYPLLLGRCLAQELRRALERR